MKQLQQVTCQLEPKNIKAAKEYATSRERPFQWVLNKALEEYLRKRNKL